MSTAQERDPADAVLSTLPDLLLLLADTREQWERARRDLAEAERGAERATTQVDDLTAELELTVAHLKIAQTRLEMTQDHVEGLQGELEKLHRLQQDQAEVERGRQALEAAEIQRLRSELAAATVREHEAKDRLAGVLTSTSWRVTRPVRSLVDLVRRPGATGTGRS